MPIDVSTSPPPAWPKSILYPAVGVLLAFGAPAGLIVIRQIVSGRPSIDGIAADVAGDMLTYGYLTVSTALVFVVLGKLLGKRTDRLEESSKTDSLTHLANRRHFETRLAEEVRRAARYGSPLSLLLIDVDHLKAINDGQGHAAGDAALRTVADALSASGRASDLAARWGGDEFVVLAPGVDGVGGHGLAERIRETLRPPFPGAPAPTVSIGIADIAHAEHATSGALCAMADAALYEAKSGGRNRSVFPAMPSTERVVEPREKSPAL